jgi:hypothetical protein
MRSSLSSQLKENRYTLRLLRTMKTLLKKFDSRNNFYAILFICMTRCMLILFLVLATDSNAQSICIDTSTLSQANHYLVEGAKARRKVLDYKKLILLDSIEIAQLDSIRTIQSRTIQTKQSEINSLRSHEKTLKSQIALFSLVAFVIGLIL